MSIKELNGKSDELRRSLVKLVFTEEQHNLPDLDAIRNAIAQRARLDSEIEELKHKSGQLSLQQAELLEIERELASAQQALANAEASLNAMQEPLGADAFKGFLRGRLKDQPLFVSRKTCADKLVALRKEHENLQSATGFFARTKAKAQQAVIWGKIQIEETRAKHLDGKIGIELIQTRSEEMVNCDETTVILTQIQETRIEIQESIQHVKQVQSTLDSKMTELYTTFGLQDIGNSEALAKETRQCGKLVDEKSREESALEKSLPDQLLIEAQKAVLPQNTAFTSVINELRATEVEIATLSSHNPRNSATT